MIPEGGAVVGGCREFLSLMLGRERGAFHDEKRKVRLKNKRFIGMVRAYV